MSFLTFITFILFLAENNLIYPNKSVFRPGDSWPFFTIAYEISESFDNSFEVRRVFWDISKTFDKVWHEGLLLKLNQNGITGNLLKLLHDFLGCRKQRGVLNGQHSSWDNGVPQSSILGSLLFLIYIHDLSNGVSSNCKLFGDDASLLSVVNDIRATLSIDLIILSNWAF